MQQVEVLERNPLTFNFNPSPVGVCLPELSVPSKRSVRISSLVPVFHARILESIREEEERRKKEEEEKRMKREMEERHRSMEAYKVD